MKRKSENSFPVICIVRQAAGLIEEIGVMFHVGEQSVRAGNTVQSLGRVGDHALQVISLDIVFPLGNQEATTRVTTADHFRVACVTVYRPSANLQ